MEIERIKYCEHEYPPFFIGTRHVNFFILSKDTLFVIKIY